MEQEIKKKRSTELRVALTGSRKGKICCFLCIWGKKHFKSTRWISQILPTHVELLFHTLNLIIIESCTNTSSNNRLTHLTDAHISFKQAKRILIIHFFLFLSPCLPWHYEVETPVTSGVLYTLSETFSQPRFLFSTNLPFLIHPPTKTCC